MKRRLIFEEPEEEVQENDHEAKVELHAVVWVCD